MAVVSPGTRRQRTGERGSGEADKRHGAERQGWSISPRIVPTKIASSRHACDVTPAGTGGRMRIVGSMDHQQPPDERTPRVVHASDDTIARRPSDRVKRGSKRLAQLDRPGRRARRSGDAGADRRAGCDVLLELRRQNLRRAVVTEFSFRSARPIVGLAPFLVCGRRDTATAARLWAADVEGALAMHATATLA